MTLEDVQELLTVIIVEVEVFIEARLETGVGVDEILHRPVIARDDDDKLIAVILHRFEYRLYRLASEVVLTAGSEGVGFINKQHTAECGFNYLLRLERGLPDVACDEPGAVDLDELPLFQHAYRRVQPAYDARDRGLARAGVAHEHHVQAHRRDGEPVLFAQSAHLDKVHQVLDVLLHIVKPDEGVELRHELVKVRLLLLGVGFFSVARFGLFAARSLLLKAMLFLKARLGACDIVKGIERLAALAHTARVAYRGELVGTLGYVGGLVVADIVVHCGEVEQNIREHADKGAGSLGAALGIGLGEVPIEHRREEDLAFTHGACQ